LASAPGSRADNHDRRDQLPAIYRHGEGDGRRRPRLLKRPGGADDHIKKEGTMTDSRPDVLRRAKLLAAVTPLAAAALAATPLTAAVLTTAAPTTVHTAALLGIGEHKTAVQFGALNNKYPDDGGD
jgi:hypothetical protein